MGGTKEEECYSVRLDMGQIRNDHGCLSPYYIYCFPCQEVPVVLVILTNAARKEGRLLFLLTNSPRLVHQGGC